MTLYCVSVPVEGRPLYCVDLRADGCPTRWTRCKAETPAMQREEAVEFAQRLGGYLHRHSELGRRDAKRIVIRPTVGGHKIDWQFSHSL